MWGLWLWDSWRKCTWLINLYLNLKQCLADWMTDLGSNAWFPFLKPIHALKVTLIRICCQYFADSLCITQARLIIMLYITACTCSINQWLDLDEHDSLYFYIHGNEYHPRYCISHCRIGIKCVKRNARGKFNPHLSTHSWQKHERNFNCKLCVNRRKTTWFSCYYSKRGFLFLVAPFQAVSIQCRRQFLFFLKATE